jgi:hypothetical protein
VTIRIVYECGWIIDNPLIVYIYAHVWKICSHSGGIYVQLTIREDISLYLKLIWFLYQYSIPAYREYNPSSLVINPNVQRVVHTVTLSSETVSIFECVSKKFRTDAVKFINLTTKRVSKLPTSTQLCATWHTGSLDMVVLLFTGASRYHNCGIDGGTSPEYFGYTLVASTISEIL